MSRTTFLPDRPGPLALSVAVLVLLVLLVYLPVTGYDFVSFDDPVHILDNGHVTDPSPAKLLQFWEMPRKNVYIPVTFTLWAAQAWLAKDVESGPGLGPTVFHASNLAVHVLNSVLVLLILRLILRMTLRQAPGFQPAALAGALLFSLHPVQAETVAWISEFRGVLAGCFSLTAILIYLRALPCRLGADGPELGEGPVAPRTRLWIASFIAFGFALLSKPSSASVPFLILALSGLVPGRGWKRAGRDALPFFALLLPFALLTKTIQPDAGLGWVPPIHLRPFVALDALAFYLRRLIVPVGWALDYGRTPELVLGNWQTYAIWLVPAGLAVWIWRGPRWLAAPLALFGLGLLPVSGLVPFDFQRYSTVADRYLYLPMLGPSLGLALGLARQGGRQAARPLWAGTAAALAVPAILATQGREAWRDSFSLYTRSLAANPLSPALHLNLGAELADRARYIDAETHLRESVRQYTAFIATFGRKSMALAESGAREEAEAWLALAGRVSKDVAKARYGLGVVAEATGHPDEAAGQYREALRIWPGMSAAHMALGNMLVGQAKLDEAITHYQDALRLRPDLSEARARLLETQTTQAAQEETARRSKSRQVGSDAP